MAGTRLRRPSPAMAVACLALLVALGGTGYAAIKLPANSVGTAQLQANAVTSAKVKNGSLLSADFRSGQIPRGPAGPPGAQGSQGVKGDTGPAGPVDTSKLLGKTLTVVKTQSVAAGTFDFESVDCPTGYEATGGGADPNNVLTMFVTSSNPKIAGNRTLLTPDGAQAAATGWFAGVYNSGAAATWKIAVVCAKIGA
jgi:hypothetical protein